MPLEGNRLVVVVRLKVRTEHVDQAVFIQSDLSVEHTPLGFTVTADTEGESVKVTRDYRETR